MCKLSENSRLVLNYLFHIFNLCRFPVSQSCQTQLPIQVFPESTLSTRSELCETRSRNGLALKSFNRGAHETLFPEHTRIYFGPKLFVGYENNDSARVVKFKSFNIKLFMEQTTWGWMEGLLPAVSNFNKSKRFYNLHLPGQKKPEKATSNGTPQ